MKAEDLLVVIDPETTQGIGCAPAQPLEDQMKQRATTRLTKQPHFLKTMFMGDGQCQLHDNRMKMQVLVTIPVCWGKPEIGKALELPPNLQAQRLT